MGHGWDESSTRIQMTVFGSMVVIEVVVGLVLLYRNRKNQPLKARMPVFTMVLQAIGLLYTISLMWLVLAKRMDLCAAREGILLYFIYSQFFLYNLRGYIVYFRFRLTIERLTLINLGFKDTSSSQLKTTAMSSVEDNALHEQKRDLELEDKAEIGEIRPELLQSHDDIETVVVLNGKKHKSLDNGRRKSYKNKGSRRSSYKHDMRHSSTLNTLLDEEENSPRKEGLNFIYDAIVKDFDASKLWYIKRKHYIEKPFLIKLGIVLACVFATILSPMMDEANDPAALCPTNSQTAAAIFICLISFVGGAMYLIIRFKRLNENSMFKTEYTVVAIVTTICFTLQFFLLNDSWWRPVLLLVQQQVCFIMSVVVPLHKMYKMKKGKKNQIESSENYKIFLDLFEDPIGSTSFYEFLRGEFSGESFLFVKSVNNLKRLEEKSGTSKSKRFIERIITEFLEKSSINQVNVSQKALQELKETVAADDNLDSSVFKGVLNEVRQLLYSDSYIRFKKHALYKKYMKAEGYLKSVQLD